VWCWRQCAAASWGRAVARAEHGEYGMEGPGVRACMRPLLLRCFWLCVAVLFKLGRYVGVASLYEHKVHADV
jgi:hypothetical protein